MENIDQQRLKWIEAIKTGNIEIFGAVLTDDAVWLPPGPVAVVGKPAIQAWLAPLFARFTYDFSITNVELRVVGDWAVEQGHFTSRLTDKDSGEALHHHSRYMVLWRREVRNVWQIERYVDTST